MRARNIKPDFFTDEKLIKLSYAERLFFVGLWCFADKEGFFEIKLHEMKLKLFPEQKIDIKNMLKNLEKQKIVKLHDRHGYLPNFEKHQRPHPNEKKSALKSSIKQDLIKLHEQSCNYTVDPSDIRNDDIIIDDIRNEESVQNWFGGFWSVYPKKIAKAMAEKAFKKLKMNNELFNKIMVSLKKQRISDQWTKDGGQYIPNPATWLNGRRWEDEGIDSNHEKFSNLNQTQKSIIESEARDRERRKENEHSKELT